MAFQWMPPSSDIRGCSGRQLIDVADDQVLLEMSGQIQRRPEVELVRGFSPLGCRGSDPDCRHPCEYLMLQIAVGPEQLPPGQTLSNRNRLDAVSSPAHLVAWRRRERPRRWAPGCPRQTACLARRTADSCSCYKKWRYPPRKNWWPERDNRLHTRSGLRTGTGCSRKSLRPPARGLLNGGAPGGTTASFNRRPSSVKAGVRTAAKRRPRRIGSC